MKALAVLGAGAWGTALAFQLTRVHPERTIYLWGNDPKQQQDMQKDQCNKLSFPEYLFPPHLKAVVELEDAVKEVEGIIIAVPSVGFSDLIKKLSTLCPASLPMVTATKGLDPKTGKFLHTIAHEILDGKQHYSVLSGPSFASEVIAGLPTAVAIASSDIKKAEFWQNHFHNDFFRVYTTDDVIGVQLGGTVKNVLAITTGIADGLGFGANARAALITRGLSEMARLNEALGGKDHTLMGLAGVGDLILTCTDNQSRNRRFGIELGKGKSIKEGQEAVKQVVEGYYAAKLIHEVAQKQKVDMPICSLMYEILYQQLPVRDAFLELLSRAPTQE